jgi:hypothetical protein
MDIRGTAVDVQAALTATSYGGITEANLVDKSASEAISGAWSFSTSVNLTAGADLYVWDPTTIDYLQIAESGSIATISTNNNPIYFTPGGTNTVQFHPTISQFVNGKNVRVFDATNVDYLQFSETGSNSQITTNNNPLQIIPGGSYTGFFTGKAVRIYDAGNTDYVSMSHDGTDFNFAATNTTDVNFTGLTGYLTAPAYASSDGHWSITTDIGTFNSTDGWVRIASHTSNAGRGGAWITICAQGGAGVPTPMEIFVSSDWGGTAPAIHVRSTNVSGPFSLIRAGYDATNNKYIDVQAVSASDVTYTIVVKAHSTTSNLNWVADFNTTAYTPTSSYQFDPRTVMDAIYTTAGERIWLQNPNDTYTNTHLNVTGGHGVYIYDPGDTDYLKMNHDGTDFDLTCTNTTSVRIFNPNGSSMLELHDTGGAGSVSNAYLAFYDSAAARQGYVGFGSAGNSDLYINVDATGGDINLSTTSSGLIKCIGGNELRVYDSGSTDYIELSHTGSTGYITSINGDFILTTTTTGGHQNLVSGGHIYFKPNTGYYNIFQSGRGTRFYDSTNTDFAAFTHDGTDFNMSFTNTAECNWSGANLQMQDSKLVRPRIVDYAINKQNKTTSGGTLSIDMTVANAADYTFTENITTVTITNPPASGQYGELWLKLIQHASAPKTISWASKYKWPGGGTHVMSTGVTDVDIIHLCTIDGGTTYYCSFMKNMS